MLLAVIGSIDVGCSVGPSTIVRIAPPIDLIVLVPSNSTLDASDKYGIGTAASGEIVMPSRLSKFTPPENASWISVLRAGIILTYQSGRGHSVGYHLGCMGGMLFGGMSLRLVEFACGSDLLQYHSRYVT